MPKVRIQKFLSDAGIVSRRAAEQMILDGRITVNGQLVLSVPCFIDPEKDDIRVDSLPVPRRPARAVYVLLNKPRGVVCVNRDPGGRPRVFDLVPGLPRTVCCIAPLDPDSTGLVLLTNDGELIQRLTSRRARIERRYVAEVSGRLDESDVGRLHRGLFLDGRRTSGLHVRVFHRGPDRSVLELRAVETHNRQVRRMLASVAHKVRRLKRTALGPLTDRGLKIGHFRPLSREEVSRLTSGRGN